MQFIPRRARIARLLAATLFVAPAAQFVTLAHTEPGQPAAAASNPNRTVGPQADGSIVASSNQVLTPAGKLVVVGPQGPSGAGSVRAKAVAVNPNPKSNTAAILTMYDAEVAVINTVTGELVQQLGGSGSFNGIAYSADGTKLYLSPNANQFVTANVDATTGQLSVASSLTLPAPATLNPHPPYGYDNTSINPGGIAISPDGTHAYVALNVGNALGVIDLATKALQATIPVGNAPNSVVVSADGHYAYVTNEGGRLAETGDYTNPSDGAAIVADPNDAFAITGTVSVVDLTTNTLAATIDVGLHPAGLTISGSRLYVTNAYSDTISVIDLNTNTVVQTIDVSVPLPGGRQTRGTQTPPGESVVAAATGLRGFGSGPNGMVVVGGRTAYVTLGTSNAIAVIDLSSPFFSPVVGYIPTAYFPASIGYDAVNKQLVVADDKGIGDSFRAVNNPSVAEASPATPTPMSGYSATTEAGAVSIIPLPNASQLAKYTEQVIDNNGWSALNPNIFVGPEFVDRFARPVPIPRHIGEPSTIKHVFLIIKENRTYDVMLGDLPQGHGDPSIAVLANATPNLHALVKRFPLLDNFYAPSRHTADGHLWIAASGNFYSNEIQIPAEERGNFQTDGALIYPPRGFLWSAALKKGLTVKLYGEYSKGHDIKADPATGTGYAWGDFYNTAMCIEGKIPASTCPTLTQVPFMADTETSNVPSAQGVLDPHFASFDLTIPDQYRMDYYLPIFAQQVATDTVPNLTIMWLGDDHSGSAVAGLPLPGDEVADNDLAFARLVEAISHSKVWESTAIFVEEDDGSADVDHIDGHRVTGFVISPWTAPPQAPDQGKVIHTTYTQENVNRTIEHILGLEPLTQFDLVASPMFDAFGHVPDLAPYTHVPATLPLNQGPDGSYLGWSGLGASFGQLELTPLQKAWIEAANVMTKDKFSRADAVDPNFESHAIWYSATGWKRPYPGDTEVRRPDEFVRAAAQKVRDDDGDDDDGDKSSMH